MGSWWTRLTAPLTARGRGLLGAGGVLLAAGALLGSRALVQLAVFTVVLPLLSVLLMALRGWSVTVTRTVGPARVRRGQEAEVLLEVTNGSRRRGGVWLVAEQLPAELGTPPRFVVDRLAAGASVVLRYRVPAVRRGRYTLGPVRVRQADPFGLVSRGSMGSDAASLLVLPRVTELAQGSLLGSQGGSGAGARRSLAVQGEDDVSAREYRYGDDLRKVHWRATARTGGLMVRLEERPERASATLLLDTRTGAHVFPPDSPGSLEWLVEAAASIGTALARRGCPVRLVTEAAHAPTSEPAALGSEELLDRLATVGPSSLPGLTAAVARVRNGAANDGPLVCLLGAVGADDVGALARARPAGASAIAVLTDLGSWGVAARDRRLPGLAGRRAPNAQELTRQRTEAARVLRAAGWQVATAGAHSSIELVWQELGRSASGSPAATGMPA